MKYKEDEDYEFVPSDDKSITAVGILKGKYRGVLYHYGKAKVVEEGEFAKLSFSYTIINPAFFTLHELHTDEEFHTMIGDILTEILMDQTNEKTRDYYPEKLDIQ